MKNILMRSCDECGVSVYENEKEIFDGMCPNCYDNYYKEAIKNKKCMSSKELLNQV